MTKKISRNAITAAGLAGLMLVGAAGGVLAYLTDAETADNTFTVGNVRIDSLEKSYPGNDSPKVKNITPGEEVAKDPTIINKGINDAVAFIVLDSPVDLVTLVNNDGTFINGTTPSAQEVFWFKDKDDGNTDSKHANNFDSNWILLDAAGNSGKYIQLTETNGKVTEEVLLQDQTPAGVRAALEAIDDSANQNKRIVYRRVFGYNKPIQGSDLTDGSAQTDANKTTTELFDKVQLKNMLEGEIDRNIEKIRVMSLAMQASNIFDSTGKDLTKGTGGTPLTAYDKDGLTAMYATFVNQNSTNGTDLTMDTVTRDGTPVDMRKADSAVDIPNGADGSVDQPNNRWDEHTDKTAAGTNVPEGGAVSPQPTTQGGSSDDGREKPIGG